MKKHKVYLQDLLNEYPESENYQKFYTYVMELIRRDEACSDEKCEEQRPETGASAQLLEI